MSTPLTSHTKKTQIITCYHLHLWVCSAARTWNGITSCLIGREDRCFPIWGLFPWWPIDVKRWASRRRWKSLEELLCDWWPLQTEIWSVWSSQYRWYVGQLRFPLYLCSCLSVCFCSTHSYFSSSGSSLWYLWCRHTCTISNISWRFYIISLFQIF